jgi:hypothetical protein
MALQGPPTHITLPFSRPGTGVPELIVGQKNTTMGAAFYIVAENKPEEMDIFVNGKALSRASTRLSSVAKKAGVRELMGFFSQNPEEAAEFVDDDAPALPPEQWFEPIEGLTTVRALIAHFSASPPDSAIVDDLREFEVVLQRLKDAGLRWHLAVDF